MMIESLRTSVDLTPQDLSGVPSDWIVETKNKEASGLLCPNNLANATLDQLTVWVDPLDGTAEYTQVESSFRNGPLFVWGQDSSLVWGQVKTFRVFLTT